jgi:hypothetical protein
LGGCDLFVWPGTGGRRAAGYGLGSSGDGGGSRWHQVDWCVRRTAGCYRQGLKGAPDRLAEVLANPARMRSMGQVSYRLVAEEANLEKMVSVFMDAVNKVLE